MDILNKRETRLKGGMFLIVGITRLKNPSPLLKPLCQSRGKAFDNLWGTYRLNSEVPPILFQALLYAGPNVERFPVSVCSMRPASGEEEAGYPNLIGRTNQDQFLLVSMSDRTRSMTCSQSGMMAIL